MKARLYLSTIFYGIGLLLCATYSTAQTKFGLDESRSLRQVNDSLKRAADSIAKENAVFDYQIKYFKKIVDSLQNHLTIKFISLPDTSISIKGKSQVTSGKNREKSLSTDKSQQVNDQRADSIRRLETSIFLLRRQLAGDSSLLTQFRNKLKVNAKLSDSARQFEASVFSLRIRLANRDSLLEKLRDSVTRLNAQIDSTKPKTPAKPGDKLTIIYMLLSVLSCLFASYIYFKRPTFPYWDIRKKEKIYCKVTDFNENFVTALAVLDYKGENERMQERLFETSIVKDVLSYQDLKNGGLFEVLVLNSVAGKAFLFRKYGKKSQDIFGESVVDGTETLNHLNKLFAQHENQSDL